MCSKLQTLIFFTTLTALAHARNLFDGPCGEGETLTYGKCTPILSDVENNQESNTPFNIVTVPPNCPPGQQWINGQCRDVWIKRPDLSECLNRKAFVKEKCFEALKLLLDYINKLPSNIIVSPGNCPNGQQLVNGVCRDVWRAKDSNNNVGATDILLDSIRNIVTAPGNCPSGQQLVNGVCTEVWSITFIPNNVVTAPDNCPSGQQLVNGVCTEIWTITFVPNNIVTVPGNCPQGQQLVNGVCRDVWLLVAPDSELDVNRIRNIVTAPGNCPSGQQLVNGVCTEVWSITFVPSNVVTAPDNCPSGQQLVNEVCTEIWTITFVPNNIVTAPDNCPVGQQLVNDVCRDVWFLIASDSESFRNIITVPNQCPAGYVPDANGVCRKVW